MDRKYIIDINTRQKQPIIWHYTEWRIHVFIKITGAEKIAWQEFKAHSCNRLNKHYHWTSNSLNILLFVQDIFYFSL